MYKFSPTAEAILDCARTLIVTGGYNGFSYADIASVVGIRKPSIHHHFPSKAQLVTALVTRNREEAEKSFTHLVQAVPAPVDQLRAYIEHWKACIGDASAPFCVSAQLATELPVLPEIVAVQIRAYFRFLSGWLRAVLERGVQQGAIALLNAPNVEAESCMAMVHGAMLSARAYGNTAIFGVVMDPHLARLSATRSAIQSTVQ